MKLYESYEDEYKYYFVMELLQGKNLLDYLATSAHSSITEKFISSIMIQLLAGLAHCHSLGFIHRDINPQNLMFSDKENTLLKIIDFGLAQNFDIDRKFEGVCGNILYTSPEVLMKKPYETASDIWSAGITCYFLFSGKFPYEDSSTDQLASLMSEIKMKTVTEKDMSEGIWNDISKEAKDFILSMLQKDPKKRKTAQELLKDPWLTKGNDAKLKPDQSKKIQENMTKNYVIHLTKNLIE